MRKTKRHEFTEREISATAFRVYSNSDFAFSVDANGTYYVDDSEVGTLENVESFLLAYATLEIPAQYKHEYVDCLPESLATAIMNEVKSEISTLRLSEAEKAEAIENAQLSKVCELTDTIAIAFV